MRGEISLNPSKDGLFQEKTAGGIAIASVTEHSQRGLEPTTFLWQKF
jgi:hypothetical protein